MSFQDSNLSHELWFVYILLCQNNSLYTGITKDVDKRFKVHLSGKGAKYTKIYPPIKILYKEQVSSHSLAIKREREIKSYSRNQKLTLINIGD